MTQPSLEAWIDGIGVRGPGLAGWPATRDVLRDPATYRSEPTAFVAPSSLPPAERRRVGRGVKIALEVGHEAVAHAGRAASDLPSVFTSSSGDGDNCDAICRALAGDRLISPTRFHNSVHNAPAGYWGIAAAARRASTSLCAFDASFAAGLVDALTQLDEDNEAVLLVAYDAPYPQPLFAARPTPDAFGVGLVLARARGPRSLARIAVSGSRVGITTSMRDASLERWRATIPAARALPMLDALARVERVPIAVEDVNGRTLSIDIHPVNESPRSPS